MQFLQKQSDYFSNDPRTYLRYLILFDPSLNIKVIFPKLMEVSKINLGNINTNKYSTVLTIHHKITR